MKKQNVRIAKELIRLAKSLISSNISFYTKNEIINKERNYAKQLFQQFNNFFINDELNPELYIAQKTIKVDLSKIQEQYKKIIDVTAIMFYVDKVNKKDYINGVMRPEYGDGTGQSLVHNGKNYVVIYGHSEWCNEKDYFMETFIHQLMHTMNYQFDEDYDKIQNVNYYFGHPIQEQRDDNNGGIPYPGMYGDNDDFFDERFAEYYTCRAERKESIHDLLSAFQWHIQRVEQNNNKKFNNEQIKELIQSLIKSLNNKNDFFRWLEKIQKEDPGFNDTAMPFIYHLAFSKQQNGNKQDAIKILKDIYWEIKD